MDRAGQATAHGGHKESDMTLRTHTTRIKHHIEHFGRHCMHLYNSLRNKEVDHRSQNLAYGGKI